MLGVFCYSFLGGAFFLSRLSRSRDDDDEDEWETYMSTRNGIFSFSSYIYLVQRTNFFSFSPTQEVIRVKIATLCWLCCCCCRR